MKVGVYVKSRGAALIRGASTNREFMVVHFTGITLFEHVEYFYGKKDYCNTPNIVPIPGS